MSLGLGIQSCRLGKADGGLPGEGGGGVLGRVWRVETVRKKKGHREMRIAFIPNEQKGEK